MCIGGVYGKSCLELEGRRDPISSKIEQRFAESREVPRFFKLLGYAVKA